MIQRIINDIKFYFALREFKDKIAREYVNEDKYRENGEELYVSGGPFVSHLYIDSIDKRIKITDEVKKYTIIKIMKGRKKSKKELNDYLLKMFKETTISAKDVK